MKIVINIPKELYEANIRGLEAGELLDLRLAVKNGIPLPKGHGRLIAEPTREDIAKTIGGKNDFADCIRDAVKAVFHNAPTIIEADKEESEDKACMDCYYNDGEVHAECVICDKAESEVKE